jgi:EAL domain-containing protein (putative c-di-GMP-specific phosphodiesterase class I)
VGLREASSSGQQDRGDPGKDLLVLHAQRLVDVVSGLTLRHELFPRMVDRRRLIHAGEFVPAAEQFGSIREIDRWVVGRAIEIAARGARRRRESECACGG